MDTVNLRQMACEAQWGRHWVRRQVRDKDRCYRCGCLVHVGKGVSGVIVYENVKTIAILKDGSYDTPQELRNFILLEEGYDELPDGTR